MRHTVTKDNLASYADQHATLEHPGLHDGLLTGMLLGDKSDANKSVTLMAKNSSGEAVAIRLDGLEMLRAFEFYEGNIISTLWLWPLALMPDRYWEALGKNRVHDHQLNAERARLEQSGPGKLGFAIDSSYGCELVAICDSVDVPARVDH